MRTIITCAFLFLSGCASAYMVSKPGSNDEFAPVNENTRTGTIQYSTEGARGIVDMRRKDAYRQMHAACRGRYKIVSEGDGSSGGVANTIGNSTFFSSSGYRTINFTCEN